VFGTRVFKRYYAEKNLTKEMLFKQIQISITLMKQEYSTLGKDFFNDIKRDVEDEEMAENPSSNKVQ